MSDEVSATDDAQTHEIVEAEDVSDDVERMQMCIDYFNREASTYDEFDDLVIRRRNYCASVDDFVVRRLSDVEDLRTVVSLGCGTGRREAAISDRLTTRPSMIGIEPAAAMAAQAEQRGLRVHPTLDADIPAVEAAVCLSAFVHLPSPEARRDALRKLAGVLVDNGVLIIDVFNIDDQHEWGPQFDSKRADADDQHGDVLYRRVGLPQVSYMHYFSVAEVTALVEQADFVVESMLGVGYMQHSGRLGVPFDQGCLLLTCKRRPR